MNHKPFSLVRRAVFAAALLSTFCAANAADPYPTKPVMVINPWAAGGPAEAIIRPIAEKLTQRLGQPFVIDSRGGANGTIGAAAVARAQPDGYTLLFSHVGPIAISPALPNKPPYDSVKDFAPITQIVSGPTVLVVRADFPAFGEFATAYVVRFPRTKPLLGAGVQQMRMRFSSARGGVDLIWSSASD